MCLHESFFSRATTETAVASGSTHSKAVVGAKFDLDEGYPILLLLDVMLASLVLSLFLMKGMLVLRVCEWCPKTGCQVQTVAKDSGFIEDVCDRPHGVTQRNAPFCLL